MMTTTDKPGPLTTIIQRLMQQPGSTHQTRGGLALGYNRVNGSHTLKLSRVGVYPSEVEVKVVRDILIDDLGFEDVTHRMEERTAKDWCTITVIFPVARQLTLGRITEPITNTQLP